MNFNYSILSPNNYPLLQIDDFYSSQEQKEIWHEIEGYNRGINKWTWEREDVNRARTESGKSLAQNSRIYLDRIYNSPFRHFSSILTHYKKITSTPVLNLYKKMGPVSRSFKIVNDDLTFISYYQNEDEYDFHTDTALHTALCFFYKTPKNFVGGDTIFKDNGITVECIHNRLIIFPSFYEHASSQLTLKNKKGYGKYTMAHFYGRI